MQRILIFICFGLIFFNSNSAISSEYWDLEIPAMDGAKNVNLSKDVNTATHTLSYDILLKSHLEPLQFYDSFFNKNGWLHFMTDTYKQFPNQFEHPPNENWSSFTARTVNEKFTLFFGTVWKNKTNNSDAQVTLEIDELEGELIKGHIEVLVSPEINNSSFSELISIMQKHPLSLLKLANLVGGDPFKLEQIDIDEVKTLESNDPLIAKYIESMDSILKQYSDFASKYVPNK